MNSLSNVCRFRSLLLGSKVNNFKSIILFSSRAIVSASSKPQFRRIESHKFLQLSQPFTSVRLHASTSSVAAVPDYKKHAHSGIWVLERIVSVGLLFLIPTALFGWSVAQIEPVVDVLIAVHVHWGLEAIFKDYLRPSIVGNLIPKFCPTYAAIVSIYLGVALLWISIHGLGVVETLKHFWTLDPKIGA